jgi:polyisoprenoid-binding protein YceI
MKRSVIFFIVIAATQLAMIKGTAEFLAKANPGFLEIEGKGGIVESTDAKIGKDGVVSGTFTVQLKDLKTGIEQRDGHMHQDYLESEKYPTAIFKLDPVSMNGGTRKAFKGALTLHGVMREVQGSVEFSSTKAVARFSVDVTKYGIKVPAYKLLTVGKEVDVSVTLDLQ